MNKLNLVKLNICPSCRQSEYRELYKLSEVTVFKCSCGVKFIDPSLDLNSQMQIYQSSDNIQSVHTALEDYYEYDFSDLKSRTSLDYQKALNELSSYVDSKSVLEVGCGSGGFAQFAKESGWQITGLDSSKENIQKLKEQGVDGVAIDFLKYKAKKKYDAIVMWDVIEHPQDPAVFLEKSRELLKDNSYLLIATPYYPNLLSFIAGIFYRMTFGLFTFPVEQMYFLEHTSYFNKKSLSLLLKKSGFKIEKIWKTETDIDRYKFSPFMRFVLKIIFFFGRIFNAKNRIVLIARKEN